MTLKFLWITLIIFVTVMHVIAASALNGGEFWTDAFPTGLGAATATMVAALIAWVPVRLLRRRQPAHWLAACALGATVLSFLFITAQLRFRDLEQVFAQRETYTFETTDCPYRVSFSREPTIQQMHLPNGLTFPQAQLVTSEAMFRAECMAAPLDDPSPNVREYLEAFSQAEGLNATSFMPHLSDIGALWTMRAFKTVDGTPVTFVHTAYYADGTVFIVAVASESSRYPPSGADAFLHSVELVSP